MEAQASFRVVANHAFIDLPSTTIEGYQLSSGIYVAPKPASHQGIEESAAVIGTVVGAPEDLHMQKLVGEENGQPVYERIPIDISEGDKVAVDYRVVAHGTWEGETFCHKNCYAIEGRMLWKAEADSLIAVLRDGHWWQALGDYALLKKAKRQKYQSSIIIIPDSAKEEEEKNIAVHVSGLDVPKGAKVFFQPQFATPYQFESGEEMLVIRKDYVFGVIDDSEAFTYQPIA